jgi:hypothetical protein
MAYNKMNEIGARMPGATLESGRSEDVVFRKFRGLRFANVPRPA